MIGVRWDFAVQGGTKSGRVVSTIISGAVGTWSINSPSNSNVEGSAQCRSSHTCKKGSRSEASRLIAMIVSCVCCFCCCGDRLGGG